MFSESLSHYEYRQSPEQAARLEATSSIAHELLAIGFAPEGSAEPVNNKLHFDEEAKIVGEIAFHPDLALDKEQIEILEMLPHAHDLGKSHSLRQRIIEIFLKLPQYHSESRSELPQSEQDTLAYIESLKPIERQLLAEAAYQYATTNSSNLEVFEIDEFSALKNVASEIRTKRQGSNWVIDHQIFSAIYRKLRHAEAQEKFLTIEKEGSNREEFMNMHGFMPDETEEKLLIAIREHIGPPHFMLDVIGKGNGYTPRELEGLCVCANYDLETNTHAYRQGNLNQLGFSSREAAIFQLIDTSQFGDPNGSLIKISQNIIQLPSFWPEHNLKTNGDDVKIKAPDITIDSIVNTVLQGSYGEGKVLVENNLSQNHPLRKLFERVDQSAEQFRLKITNIITQIINEDQQLNQIHNLIHRIANTKEILAQDLQNIASSLPNNWQNNLKDKLHSQPPDLTEATTVLFQYYANEVINKAIEQFKDQDETMQAAQQELLLLKERLKNLPISES